MRRGIITSVVLWEIKPGENPPALERLIGRCVRRAWLLPENKCLFVLFYGGSTLMVEAMPTRGGLFPAAVQIETGDSKLGASFHHLDRLIRGPRDPHLDLFTGLQLTGLDGDVLLFEIYGAQFLPDGVQWVELARDAQAAVPA
jgi:hypothetical protein